MEDVALQKILEARVIGNHYNDQWLFNLIDQYLIGDHPMENKIKALEKTNLMVGENDVITSVEVERHIAFLEAEVGFDIVRNSNTVPNWS